MGKIDENKGETELVKHSVSIAGHRTSISLENTFWRAFREIAKEQGTPVARLITRIDADRTTNLSSAIRVYVLNHYRRKPDQRQA